MCTSPVYIRNTSALNGLSKYKIDLKYAHFRDTCFYTAVPCGRCNDCLIVKQSGWLQRIEEMYKEYYMIFGTATYQSSMVPTYTTSLGEIIYYPDYSDFRNMIKRIRKDEDFPSFKYMCVSEFGSNTHRPHFHYFIFVKRKPDDSPYIINNLVAKWTDIFIRQWKRRVSSSQKYSVYKPLSKFLRFRNGTGTYDIHAVLPRTKKDGTIDTVGNVSHYVTKYILKPDDYVDKLLRSCYVHYATGEKNDEYSVIRNLFRQRIYCSLGIGLTESSEANIKSFIFKSKVNSPRLGPRYFSSETGKGTYLSRYYQHKYLELCDIEFFANHSDNKIEYNGRILWLPDTSYTLDDIEKMRNRNARFDKARKVMRESDTLNLLRE